jgi:hypothetical protein
MTGLHAGSPCDRGRVARLRCDRGQATVEVVALLPLLVAVIAAVFCLLSAGRAADAAGSAAQAGAIALLQDGDADEAARRALAGWPRGATDVRVTGRRVAVTVRPALLIRRLSSALAGRAAADAGPAGMPAAVRGVRGGDGLGGGVEGVRR